jgi:phosphoglycerol transferase MdoB-like AlkP superfamily enzyme
LMIFVEGLDRRYLGRSVQAGHSADGIVLTPFLDRLKQDSLYYENFFTNGVQTSRGLFATLCSAYPRYGTAVIKTRFRNNFLCLPSVLREGGYRTEMVVGQGDDINNLDYFLGRNGMDRLFDEADFPQEAERLAMGITDGALLDFMRGRVESLRRGGRPFFLATLTSGMHHPFPVPARHREVVALGAQPDGYLAALRNFDLEFERVFTGLRMQGLLNNTIVVILGDHGRHEPIGRTETERQAGHFMAPLFIWIDDSLRSPKVYRPRVIKTVASQVDLAPTLLAVNGLLPEVSPFMGRDLSCTWSMACEDSNWAFLSSVYDDLIGLADRDGLWLYSFRTGSLVHANLSLSGQASRQSIHEPDAKSRYVRMVALHVSSNVLLEQNRIWNRRSLEEAP